VRIPVVHKLVTETGLIVCQYTVRRTQYDRLSQKQLSFFLFIHFLTESDSTWTSAEQTFFFANRTTELRSETDRKVLIRAPGTSIIDQRGWSSDRIKQASVLEMRCTIIYRSHKLNPLRLTALKTPSHQVLKLGGENTGNLRKYKLYFTIANIRIAKKKEHNTQY